MNTDQQQKAVSVIGAFAVSISRSWGVWCSVPDRLNAIMDIADKYLPEDDARFYREQIEKYWDEMCADGRWMRDEWIGPYTDGARTPISYFEDLGVDSKLLGIFKDNYVDYNA